MTGRHIEQFSDIEFDVLKEISNIGAGNATTAISSMMGAKVDMHVPNIKLLEFQELAEIIGGAENQVVGILFGLEHDIDGMMMFIMNRANAEGLADRMLGVPHDEENELDEIRLSALKEFGNIIAGSYLAAVSGLTKLTISVSVPYISVDMAGAILSVPAIEYGKVSDKVLLIESEVGDEDMMLSGYFILVPTLDAFEKIFGSLGLSF